MNKRVANVRIARVNPWALRKAGISRMNAGWCKGQARGVCRLGPWHEPMRRAHFSLIQLISYYWLLL